MESHEALGGHFQEARSRCIRDHGRSYYKQGRGNSFRKNSADKTPKVEVCMCNAQLVGIYKKVANYAV